MTPIRLSNTWSKRLYVGLFLLAIGYVLLFALQQYSSLVIPETIQVNGVIAGGALLTAIGSVLGYIFIKKSTSFLPSFITFAVFTLTTAYLVQQTGGVNSLYLAVWTLVIFFSPLFGAYGWLPVLVMIGSYIAGIYLNAQLNAQSGIIVAISSFIPLVAGMIIWRDHPAVEDASQKNVKNLASQLSEVAQKSEIVINAIGDGVIAIDSKGVIQLINPAAQQILGWGKQDALMLSYKSILKLTDENNKDVPDALDPLQQVLNNNQQTKTNKLSALTESGKKINISLTVSPIGGAGSGAIAVFRDVTNERAEEREQAEFISTASHEMRTPVASIEGYLGLALNPATAQIDAKARDFIMKAHEAAQHLGRLFQDLLDVSKSEDGRMTNIPKVVDLVTYTQTIAEGLTQKAADKGLELIFKPQTSGTQKKIMPVYYINQDNDHVREVIDNLIENAIKYTPQGSVTVDVTGTDEKVVVSIQDTGLGIPPEDVSHLFQKFYRVDNVDRQQIGGTGLGLYLSRRLAEAMQGRLWVESNFGSGSTFFLELPRIDSQEATRLKEEQDRQTAQLVQAPAPVAPTPIPVTVVSTPLAPTVAPMPAQQAPVAVQQQMQPITPTQVAPQQYAPVAVPVAPTPQVQQYQQVQQPVAQQTPVQAVPVAPVAPQQAAQAPDVRPATTVPRGESLSREQIAERVRQLEALSLQQRNIPPGRQ